MERTWTWASWTTCGSPRSWCPDSSHTSSSAMSTTRAHSGSPGPRQANWEYWRCSWYLSLSCVPWGSLGIPLTFTSVSCTLGSTRTRSMQRLQRQCSSKKISWCSTLCKVGQFSCLLQLWAKVVECGARLLCQHAKSQWWGERAEHQTGQQQLQH